jgi:Uma2 family endonuclease
VQTQVYLTPKDHGRPLSLEEFEHAASREGYHYELINGRLEVSPLPDFAHGYIRKVIERLLDLYAEQHPEVLRHVQAPARVFVPGRRATTAPEPDVAAYRDYPVGTHYSRIRWQDLRPILVVEILSADSADKDLIRNRRLYLAVPSIREYWVIDPRQDSARPELIVYRRRGARWQRPMQVPPGSTYTTRLLPGFTLTLAEAGGDNRGESRRPRR